MRSIGISSQVVASQTLTVAIHRPATRRLPSRLYATQVTVAGGALEGIFGSPVAVSQIFTV